MLAGKNAVIKGHTILLSIKRTKQQYVSTVIFDRERYGERQSICVFVGNKMLPWYPWVLFSFFFIFQVFQFSWLFSPVLIIYCWLCRSPGVREPLFKGTTDETQRPGQRCTGRPLCLPPLLCVGSAWGSRLVSPCFPSFLVSSLSPPSLLCVFHLTVAVIASTEYWVQKRDLRVNRPFSP